MDLSDQNDKNMQVEKDWRKEERVRFQKAGLEVLQTGFFRSFGDRCSPEMNVFQLVAEVIFKNHEAG